MNTEDGDRRAERYQSYCCAGRQQHTACKTSRWMFRFLADMFSKVENRNVMPFWVFDLNRSKCDPVLVKLAEFRSKAPGFDANDRIGPWIVCGRSSVNLHPKAILLQRIARARKSALDGEFQKTAQLRRA